MLCWALYWVLLQSSFTFDQFPALPYVFICTITPIAAQALWLDSSRPCTITSKCSPITLHRLNRLPALSANHLQAGLGLVRAPEWLQTLLLWCFPVEFLITVKLFTIALLKMLFFSEPQTHNLHNVSVNSKQYNTKDLHKHRFKFGFIFAEVTPGLYLPSRPAHN